MLEPFVASFRSGLPICWPLDSYQRLADAEARLEVKESPMQPPRLAEGELEHVCMALALNGLIYMQERISYRPSAERHYEAAAQCVSEPQGGARKTDGVAGRR